MGIVQRQVFACLGQRDFLSLKVSLDDLERRLVDVEVQKFAYVLLGDGLEVFDTACLNSLTGIA